MSIKQAFTKQYVRHIEQNAIQIRSRLGLDLTENFDPFKISRGIGVSIIYPDENRSIASNPDMMAYLQTLDAKVWSAMGGKLDTGNLLIVLNRNQTIQRARVSIMEEVAHEHYEHKPSISPYMFEGKLRFYDQANEQEAYHTGAATLLPSVVIAMSVHHGKPASEIAEMRGTSIELVEMRIKTLSLWHTYLTRAMKEHV